MQSIKELHETYLPFNISISLRWNQQIIHRLYWQNEYNKEINYFYFLLFYFNLNESPGGGVQCNSHLISDY